MMASQSALLNNQSLLMKHFMNMQLKLDSFEATQLEILDHLKFIFFTTISSSRIQHMMHMELDFLVLLHIILELLPYAKDFMYLLHVNNLVNAFMVLLAVFFYFLVFLLSLFAVIIDTLCCTTLLCLYCVWLIIWLDTLLRHLSLFGNDKGGEDIWLIYAHIIFVLYVFMIYVSCRGRTYTYACYICYICSLQGKFVHTLFVIIK